LASKREVCQSVGGLYAIHPHRIAELWCLGGGFRLRQFNLSNIELVEWRERLTELRISKGRLTSCCCRTGGKRRLTGYSLLELTDALQEPL
jgi:hypothetical protein